MAFRSDRSPYPLTAGSAALGQFQVRVTDTDIGSLAGTVAVVSSDDNYLSHGGGSSAAIWRAVGRDLSTDPAIMEVVHEGQRPSLADIVVSHVGPDRIPVLHAITIDFDEGTRIEPDDIATLYGRVLDAALSNKVGKLAMPLLGTGDARVEPRESLERFIDALTARAALPLALDVELLIRDPRINAYREAITEMMVERRSGIIDGRQRGAWASTQSEGIQRTVEALNATSPETAQDTAVDLWSLLQSESTSPGPEAMEELRDPRLARARSARNRIVHYRSVLDAGLLRDLVVGCDLLLARASSTPADSDVIPDPARAGSVRSLGPIHGTDHVRTLHRLLQESLTRDEMDSEHKRLQALGYRGDLSGCLLESCVAENPVDLLLQHFSGRQLTGLLDDREIPYQPSDPPGRKAMRLLQHIGFPADDDLVDPVLVQRTIAVERSTLPGLNEANLTGLVASVSRSMESVLKVYLRFLTDGILKVPPDKWIEDQRSRSSTHRLPPSVTKATFGQLVRLVESVGKDIETRSDAHTQWILAMLPRHVGKSRWIPGRAHDLVRRRNIFVHGEDQTSNAGTISLTGMREQAQEFLDSSAELLDFLIDGPFPTVIRVEEVVFDKWGRKRIRGRTSNGTREEIFTDQPLQPGHAYLMISPTNPLRIDPLLVRLGAEASS